MAYMAKCMRHIVLICLARSLVLSTAEDVYSSTSYANAYGNILKVMKINGSMEYEKVSILLKRLQLQDCSNSAGHKHKCITASSLFQLNNISKDNSQLKDKDFAKFSTFILYALLPELATQGSEQKYITQQVDVYKEILQRYATSVLCERVVDKVLEDINSSMKKQLTKRECFSSRGILQELQLSNDLEITKASFPLISITIVSKLLNGYCIKVGNKDDLPCPSYFVKKLFNKYASNGTMSKDEMDELLMNLRIGRDRQLKANAIVGNDDSRRRKRDITRMLPQYLSVEDVELRVGELRGSRLQRRSIDQAKPDSKAAYRKCYSVDELFSIYKVDENAELNIHSFQRFLSALIEQIESDVCHSDEDYANPHDYDVSQEKIPSISVWGYAFAAVSAVSLCSLVMIIPLMRTKFYEKSLVFLISLAVGTLVGDACLHLLPHATGFHGHGADEYTKPNKNYLWKFVAILAGVYGLFFFETTTHFLLRVMYTRKLDNNKKDNNPTKNDIEEKPPVVLVNKSAKQDEIVVEERLPELRNIHPDNMKPTIASMAWTVIIGDTLHNIADGIAIGVAFSDSIIGGMSTSIAVLCHEVPHELGDFVVLLSAGMSVRQALLANFLSACFCFLGLILGKSIGDIEDYNLWILGITAGFFLYIALTNKLPELMHVSAESELPKTLVFVLQQTGIIAGFLGMFLLAYFKTDFF